MTRPALLDPERLVPAGWASHTPDPQRGEAWRQSHHAIRIVANAAGMWGEPLPHHEGMMLRWHSGARALVSSEIRGSGTNFRVGYRFADPAFLLCDTSFATLQQFEIGGRKLTEARGWLYERAEKLAGGTARNDLPQLPRMGLHPIEEGAPFGDGCADGFRSVGRAYANAHHVLGLLREELDQHDAPILCEPEHMDISCRLECPDDDRDEDPTRFLHVGLSPGGDRREFAYWFVEPLPQRTDAPAERLAAGQWITKGPLLAALDHTEVTEIANGAEQAKLVARFFSEAVEACQGLS